MAFEFRNQWNIWLTFCYHIVKSVSLRRLPVYEMSHYFLLRASEQFAEKKMSIFVDGGLTFYSGSVSMYSTSGPVLIAR